MKPSFVSVHQPTLFGSAGYWSKIALADTHVVMASSPYRVEDKLSSAVLPSGGTLHLALHAAPRIEDVRVAEPAMKAIKTLKQEFGKKSMPFRGRLEPVIDALEHTHPDELFLSLWGRMASAIMQECSLVTDLVAASAPDQGDDTQARLEQKVAPWMVPSAVLVLGPGSVGYMDRKPRYATVIHRMLTPRTSTFLLDLVTLAKPVDVLDCYALEALR